MAAPLVGSLVGELDDLADVRDALAWSKYLGEALQMWGGKADAMCGQHHWPVWGA